MIASLLQPALFEGRHINVVTGTKGGHTPGMTVADGCRLTKSESNAVVMGEVGREGSVGC